MDLNELIGNLTGMLGRVIRENIELVFETGEDVGCVNADPKIRMRWSACWSTWR